MWPARAFQSDIVPQAFRNPLLKLGFLLWMEIYKDEKLPRSFFVHNQPYGAHPN
jgi:hypothetical protein